MPEYNSQKIGPGVVVVGAVIALIFMILMVGKIPLVRAKPKIVTIYFDSVSGVKERTDVTYAGGRCGEVRKIVFLDKPKEHDGTRYHVEVVAEIDPATPVNSKTKALITLVGMLGDKELDLRPGPEAPPLDGPIYGESGGLDVLITTARQMAIKLEPLLDDLQKLTVNLNGMLATPGFKDDLTATVARAKSALEKAETTLAQVDDILRENRGDLRAFFGDARGLTEKGAAAFGTVDRAVTETKPKLQAMIGDIQRLVNELQPKLDELLKKTDISLDKANASLDRADITLGKTDATLDKTNTMLDTSQAILGDNQENIVLLLDSLRQTSYNTKHVTHTLRGILSPWSVFSSQERPAPPRQSEPRLGPVADEDTPLPPDTTKARE